MKSYIIILLGCLLIAQLVNGQTQVDDSTLSKKEIKQSEKQRKIENGELVFSPVVLPVYTPEVKFAISGGGVVGFKTDKTDSLINRSSIPIFVGYSTTGSFTAAVRPVTFWNEDKIRFSGEFWYKKMPDHYWGVGYDKAINIEKSDTTTAYNRSWFWINPQFLFRLKKNMYAGVSLDWNYTNGTNASNGVLVDSNYNAYKSKPLNSGIGLNLQYDSRDLPFNAWKGHYLSFTATFYGNYLGGDNTYQTYLLDYRNYTSIKPGRTLASSLRVRVSEGDVPYGELSQLGNPFEFRGYYWGHYRDKSMALGVVEYRHQFKKSNSDFSRHGMVTWIAAGSVFGTEKHSSESSILPNFGAGYRFELQNRMNLRFDVGLGKDSKGIYININEAF